jgi:hypothetical protein
MLGRGGWRRGEKVRVCFEAQGKYAGAVGDEAVYFGVEEEAGDFAGERGFFVRSERVFEKALVESFGALNGCGSA